MHKSIDDLCSYYFAPIFFFFCVELKKIDSRVKYIFYFALKTGNPDDNKWRKKRNIVCFSFSYAPRWRANVPTLFPWELFHMNIFPHFRSIFVPLQLSSAFLDLWALFFLCCFSFSKYPSDVFFSSLWKWSTFYLIVVREQDASSICADWAFASRAHRNERIV